MLVDGKPYRSLWWAREHPGVRVIDQRHLPHALVVEDLDTVESVFTAIREMHVRGAPLIGAAAACGAYLATTDTTTPEGVDASVIRAVGYLKEARPTAVNLAWAADQVRDAVLQANGFEAKIDAARNAANRIIEDELDRCRLIGEMGLQIIEAAAARTNRPLNILTHCNAGWLACIDYGTATAPIYLGHDRGLKLHVWVDETRPRNQGARLTAWELGAHGVPHTVITDNAGGHLMQRGEIDFVLVGTDRTTRQGHVVNKIGTYLKALAAADNDIPFYVALPSSSIDWSVGDPSVVPIEERDPDEVHYTTGSASGGGTASVRVTPPGSSAANYAFDVTPANLVTAFITERGICPATESGLRSLFPESENR
ncbi:MAG: S-methyl-5-thioribose-1-phosphate isomerase [Rhodothermia bacterium]|nr:S-methyl-5-thioribose-1-phosphate isomerase [Rhodothermia bacterium]